MALARDLEERLHVVEVLVDGAERDARPIGDHGRRGPQVTLFDQVQDGVHHGIARAQGASGAPVESSLRSLDNFLHIGCKKP